MFSGGKLPMTWYPQEYLANVPMTNMAMRSNPSKGYPGRTYRFYDGNVVYPFGHGMSYTSFTHTIVTAPRVFSVPLSGHRVSNSSTMGKAIRVTHTRCSRLSLGLEIDVRNTGPRDGAHTLLVFSTPPAVGQWAPKKQLVAFKMVHVPAGAQQRVGINIHVCKYLSVVDWSGIRRVPMGEHSLHIGDLSHSVTLQAAILE